MTGSPETVRDSAREPVRQSGPDSVPQIAPERAGVRPSSRRRRQALRAAWRRLVRDVLARPLRIGILVLLAVSVATVAVGAQGWWILLGVLLFLAAASGLVALWLDDP